MTSVPATTTRQPRLFHLESSLSVKLGSAFFRSIPSEPGVYFFYDRDDTLLYIGQSADLRARVGSYRHVTPEKNPRRTLRLVARTTRIEWELCDSAATAIERERVLLLERRPPFNRAGVWKGDPWWLAMAEKEDGMLQLTLTREAGDGFIGPLPPAARYVLVTLLRMLLRIANPAVHLAGFPQGLMNAAAPRELRIALPDSRSAMQTIAAGLQGDVREVLEALGALPPAGSTTEQEFWQEEAERLSKYAAKMAREGAQG
ncbi:MAG: GIY-YIG nuclease family protein [Verrucomicrobiaceae bacterium]|nr:GIY-YIG nuclease family protein [Verrucomicrobiaceae bacterium]